MKKRLYFLNLLGLLIKRGSRITLLTLAILMCLSITGYAQNLKKISSTKGFKDHLKAAKITELKTTGRRFIDRVNYKSANGEERIVGSVKGRKGSNAFFKFAQGK